VRAAAVEALSDEPPEQRSRWLLPLASDQVRAVRIEVAQALAGVPLTGASGAESAALARATDEYLATQQFNADRPEAHSNLGLYYARIGQQQRAQAEFQRALAIDPGFVPAAVNLADLYRAGGEEARAEAVLRAALPASHDDASLHYALGLSLARQQRMPEALAQLQQVARLAPEQPRYAYVYGVALHSAGRQAEGIAVLAAAHAKFPGDSEILQALATMERDRGRNAAARDYARQLVQLTPDDPQAQALLRALGP
jgi:tetratricopeptide (TPR) repeat protein